MQNCCFFVMHSSPILAEILPIEWSHYRRHLSEAVTGFWDSWHWCCSWRSLSCHTIKVLVYTPGPLPFSSSGNEILWLNAGNVISEVIHHVINRVFSASICLSGIMKVTFLVAGGSAEPRFLPFRFNACMGHSYHFSNELLSTFYRVKSLPKSLIRSRNWFLR